MPEIRSFFLYVDSEPVMAPPADWHSMQRILTRSQEHVRETIKGNYIEIADATSFENCIPETDLWEEKLLWMATATVAYLLHQEPFDIMAIGQTPYSELVLSQIRHPIIAKIKPFLIIRFSMLHYDDSISENHPPICPVEEMGYHLDCPKDLQVLFDLLTFSDFLEAVSKKSINHVKSAIEAFNVIYPNSPISIYFSRIM